MIRLTGRTRSLSVRLSPLMRRVLIVVALAAVVAYGALLRVTVLSDMYGPFASPAWLSASERAVQSVRATFVPAAWTWKKVENALRRWRSRELPAVRARDDGVLPASRSRAGVPGVDAPVVMAHGQCGRVGQSRIDDVRRSSGLWRPICWVLPSGAPASVSSPPRPWRSNAICWRGRLRAGAMRHSRAS